jgi:hypothetical protein
VDEAPWVEAHRPLVLETYRRRQAASDNQWPVVLDPQRWVDQRELDENVKDAFADMPELIGSQHWPYREYAVVPLRLLRFLSETAELINICWAITQAAVAQYLAEGADLYVQSSDPLIQAVSSDTALIKFAAHLLSEQPFTPISSPQWNADSDSWQAHIDQRWMTTYRGAESVDDFFERQAGLAEQHSVERAARMFNAETLIDEEFEPHIEESATPDDVSDQADEEYDYDVALSFAEENRSFVADVAARLKARGVRYFYDDDHQHDMWGQDLTVYFDLVFRKKSRFTVMFISEQYAKKPWARHERRSALSHMLASAETVVLPVCFDDTELDGLQPTIHYLHVDDVGVEGLVAAICARLGHPS